MCKSKFQQLFSTNVLRTLFPDDLSDRFFEALYGDAEEGAYDIYLVYSNYDEGRLQFEFHLKQREGKCLACNLTYGLPNVFARHPILNIKGLVQEIEKLMDNQYKCARWQLGKTFEVSSILHTMPLSIWIEDKNK